MVRSVVVVLFVCLLLETSAGAQGERSAEGVRRIPPPGVTIPAADRAELEAGVAELGRKIETLRTSLKAKPALLGLLPDVQIFHNAVRYALVYDEFYNVKEAADARAHLKAGMERAAQLEAGTVPWTTQTGLVVRGYVSRIDGSVQPYGLVVPASFRAGAAARKHRLDVFFHGRGETLTELSFLAQRQRSPGQFTPADAFVLHPYGRYCNANRFAGEVDLFEALADVKKRYVIDEDRIVVRGFSMGGASCWQFATHYADRWAAAAPGAGFSETAGFLRVFGPGKTPPPWYEQKLWHLYDSTDYAANLWQCPTIAYSGENDGQKQAADAMTRAMAAEGLEMVHIVGPGTGHRYHPDSKVEIDRRIDAFAARGRNRVPRRIRFTTWTLRYHRMNWVTVDGLDRHWERARVDADVRDGQTITVQAPNVSALTLSFPAGQCPLDPKRRPSVLLDGQKLAGPPVAPGRAWTARFRKTGGRWAVVAPAAAVAEGKAFRKRHGLQGPIDDAFMERFLFVKPTGAPMNARVGAWVGAEAAHAAEHWRRQFRGEAPVKDDAAITDQDIANSNLVLWGDPSSNRILARIAAKLPVRWTAAGLRVGPRTYSADSHVPVLVYPNPLNPRRYVVLNSGFTFREFDYLNNARQTPKLPDWAVIDVRTPPSPRAPGAVAGAGFFGERWELQPDPPGQK